jgi:hypothetical protein
MPAARDLAQRAGTVRADAAAVRAHAYAVADVVAQLGLEALTRAERFRDVCDDIADSIRARGEKLAAAGGNFSRALDAVFELARQQRAVIDAAAAPPINPLDHEQTK